MSVRFWQEKWSKLFKNLCAKSIAIGNQGSAWEPAKHLIGDNSKSIMDKYLADTAAIVAADEQRKTYLIRGPCEPIEVEDNVDDTAKGRWSRFIYISSLCTVHFSEWYWDNIVTPFA